MFTLLVGYKDFYIQTHFQDLLSIIIFKMVDVTNDAILEKKEQMLEGSWGRVCFISVPTMRLRMLEGILKESAENDGRVFVFPRCTARFLVYTKI